MTATKTDRELNDKTDKWMNWDIKLSEAGIYGIRVVLTRIIQVPQTA